MVCITYIWNQVIGDGHRHQHSILDNTHLDCLHHQSQPGLAQGRQPRPLGPRELFQEDKQGLPTDQQLLHNLEGVGRW